jgi:hypothetical protein
VGLVDAALDVPVDAGVVVTWPAPRVELVMGTDADAVGVVPEPKVELVLASAMMSINADIPV